MPAGLENESYTFGAVWQEADSQDAHSGRQTIALTLVRIWAQLAEKMADFESAKYVSSSQGDSSPLDEGSPSNKAAIPSDRKVFQSDE